MGDCLTEIEHPMITVRTDGTLEGTQLAEIGGLETETRMDYCFLIFLTIEFLPIPFNSTSTTNSENPNPFLFFLCKFASRFYLMILL